MNCEAAERAVSAVMDGSERPRADVEAHIAACARCREFRRRAWRVREVVRISAAEPIPDVSPRVIARLRRETSTHPVFLPRLDVAEPPSRSAEDRLETPARRTRQAAVVALVAGVVAGAVITAGSIVPLRHPPGTAMAAEIPRRLQAAAAALKGYRATFDIVERNWTSSVPRRTFVADVAFRAPEGFRVQVRDTTRYPSRTWPRNNLLLRTDGRRWRAVGPDPCPAAAVAACRTSDEVVREVTNRPPFDQQTLTPTDIVVPMTVLAASDRVRVVGPDRTIGRDSVAIALPYRDAAPLFDYLRFLGSWRPYFPEDRVILWLDVETWFPLRYEVFPAPGTERSLWAADANLPPESPKHAIFVASARSVVTSPPPPDLFTAKLGAEAVDEGFHDVSVTRLPAAMRSLPRRVGAMSLSRAGAFRRTAGRPYRQSVLAYSSGLAWLTVTHVEGWKPRRLFGVGPFAEPVTTHRGRVGYYEPAAEGQGRRLALHTSLGEFLLTSNVPRDALVAAARALRLEGTPEPVAWRVQRSPVSIVHRRLTPRQAAARVAFGLLLPSKLPPAYRPVAAETMKGGGIEGVTIVFRRPSAELDGVGLRLHQASDGSLPPPTEATQETVLVRGVSGRWSPQQRVLEWTEDGVYVSLEGPSFDLTSLLEIAESLRTGPAPKRR